MRAIDCPCGHHFEAETDEQLFGLCRDHVDRDHPEMQRTDEQLRARARHSSSGRAEALSMKGGE